ncbi:hypothetical protein [Phytoactinopolyspora endophytica]|uniref:hypothetical protein n=1 Tax=Phytoactinopolyspora endophytica TaxID=1642495 RepID=UPI0013EBCDB0|nr:hypothetical protein [Phytoactinopolyspora endophytica]
MITNAVRVPDVFLDGEHGRCRPKEPALWSWGRPRCRSSLLGVGGRVVIRWENEKVGESP